MRSEISFVESGTITTPAGFLAGATTAGIKTHTVGASDLGILYSETAATAAGVFTTNRIKAAPLLVTSARLPADGILFAYGAYRQAGVPTAPSNEAFDGYLKNLDPRFGLRDLSAVAACAARHGLALARVEEMPANNLSLIFRKVITVSPGGTPVP